MSIITDRARTIAETMEEDGRQRFVFVMPQAFTLRVVAVPNTDDWEFLNWVEAESHKLAGLFKPGTKPEELAYAIDRAWT